MLSYPVIDDCPFRRLFPEIGEILTAIHVVSKVTQLFEVLVEKHVLLYLDFLRSFFRHRFLQAFAYFSGIIFVSGIFGVVSLAGRNISEREIRALANTQREWVHDQQEVEVFGSAAFGFTAQWNTRESVGQSGLAILNLPDRKVALTGDIRLDNREEIFRLLEISKEEQANISSNLLVLKCYLKWGERCTEFLLGDFAFAIWDPLNDTLFCARDHVGIKPFYYCYFGDSIVFGNHVHTVLAHAGVADTIDDESVARYLSLGELYSDQSTFYKCIKKLPAATTLTFSKSGLKLVSYWKLAEPIQRGMASFEECKSALRSLLDKAVSSRANTVYPLHTHISGGLDSSSISALAAEALPRNSSPLKAHCWMPPAESLEQYNNPEWASPREFAAFIGVELEYTPFGVQDILQLLSSHDISGGDTAQLWYEFKVRSRARESGARTILSGWGGDQVVTNFGRYAYADAFWFHGNFSVLSQIFLHRKQGTGVLKSILSRTYRDLLLPVIPGAHRYWSYHTPFDARPIMKAEYHEGIAHHLRAKSDFPGFRVIDQQLQEYRLGHMQNRIESMAVSGLECGIEYRYPLLDIRLLEFMLQVPPLYFRRGTTGRYLFRSAVSDILPSNNCWSSLKLEPSRVKLFLSYSRDALRLNRYQSFSGPNAGEKYLDTKGLERLVSSLADSDLGLLDQSESLMAGICGQLLFGVVGK